MTTPESHAVSHVEFHLWVVCFLMPRGYCTYHPFTLRGAKVYVEARLGDLLVQRLSPVSVDPVTGDFSYEGATESFAVFNVSPV